MGYCAVCKGTGLVQLPHFPSATGGWIDEKYITSGIELQQVGPNLSARPPCGHLPAQRALENTGRYAHARVEPSWVGPSGRDL